MSKKMRIAVIGDSTVEWIRPYRDHKNDFTYSELLMKNDSYAVDIYIKPGMTSHDALILIWQELMGKFYDYYIFSFGINDCTPRSYPKIMADFYNASLIPNTKMQKLFFLFYRLFTATKVQRIASKLKISRPWTDLKTFEKNIKRIINILTKETDAKMIFLSIPQTSKRVEDILCNINGLILEYSEIIKKHASLSVDMDSLFSEDYEKYISEGIHYSSEGHRLVYKEILARLDNNV